MGDLKSLLKMIPGMGKMVKDLEFGDKDLNKVEAIIFSMTPEERAKPELLNSSRKKRIARGCGRSLEEINMFVKQFDQMRKMMHKFSKFQGAGAGMPVGGGGGRRPIRRTASARRRKPKRRR